MLLHHPFKMKQMTRTRTVATQGTLSSDMLSSPRNRCRKLKNLKLRQPRMMMKVEGIAIICYKSLF